MKLDDILNNTITEAFDADAPEIIIMVGLPATGKSTFIRNNYSNYVIISTDDYITKMAVADGKKYNEVFKQYVGPAHDNLKQEFNQAISNDENIVWDQTNLSRGKRASILRQIPDHYKIICVIFDPPDDVRNERNKNRTDKVIPSEVIDRMKSSYEEPTKSEGFDEIIKITD